MNNPYKVHLDSFFITITDFIHSSNRINKLLLNDVKKLTAEGATFFSGTRLVIGDWTGLTDNGWKITFPTDAFKTTYKETYSQEVDKLLSREFGLAFSQCYESLQTFLKDSIWTKFNEDSNFKSKILNKYFDDRSNMKDGRGLFKLVKIAGGEQFKKSSKENNNNIKFKEYYTIITEVRHCITHSKGSLKVTKIPNDKYYSSLFEQLFPNNKLEGDTIKMNFDYTTLNRSLIYMAEFGFQIFKIFSQEMEYEWKL